MKYWSYFAAKTAAAAAFLSLVWFAMNRFLPDPQLFLPHRLSLFPQDLPWTTAILAFCLLSPALLALIVRDRRRCHRCLALLHARRTRQLEQGHPIQPARTESICPSATALEVPEIQSTGHNPPAWHAHQDI